MSWEWILWMDVVLVVRIGEIYGFVIRKRQKMKKRRYRLVLWSSEEDDVGWLG